MCHLFEDISKESKRLQNAHLHPVLDRLKGPVRLLTLLVGSFPPPSSDSWPWLSSRTEKPGGLVFSCPLPCCIAVMSIPARLIFVVGNVNDDQTENYEKLGVK